MKRFALVILALLAGCEQTTKPDPPKPSVARITIAPDSVVMLRGETRILTAVVVGTDGAVMSGVPVTWSSAHNATLTVDGSGVIRALNAGRVIVAATAGGVVDTVMVRADLYGTWPLLTANGKAPPAIVESVWPCPPPRVSGSVLVQPGTIRFSGTSVNWTAPVILNCGTAQYSVSGWAGSYRVSGTTVTFTASPTDTTTLFTGSLSTGRITVSWPGASPLPRVSFGFSN